MKTMLYVAGFLLLTAGCDSAPTEQAGGTLPEEHPVHAPEEVPAQAQAAQPELVAEERLPVMEDFEAEAEANITVDNYSAALDGLESEIGEE